MIECIMENANRNKSWKTRSGYFHHSRSRPRTIVPAPVPVIFWSVSGRNIIGTGRKTPEVTGSWKQYSGARVRRPVFSVSDRNRAELATGYGRRNTASKIRSLPTSSHRFRPDAIHLGILSLRGHPQTLRGLPKK